MRYLAPALLTMGVCLPLAALPADCVRLLEKPAPPVVESASQALALIAENLPHIVPRPQLDGKEWFHLLNNFALPNAVSPSRLLVTAIVGGGNSGKSTLMNALPALLFGDRQLDLDRPVSRTGWFAGMTRQMLVAVPSGDENFEAELRERFGPLAVWASPTDTLEEGGGLILRRSGIPENMAFIDSPDFDTGPALRDDPDNWRAALKVICPSDALMVLVGPQTYRNQAGIQRLARIFKLYGQKRAILIFWGDPGMPLAEVNQYLRNTAQAIFGGAGGDYPFPVLGAYFMPYSLEVARGEAHPMLLPLKDFTSFAALVKYMSIDSAAIKNFSLQNAANTIVGEVREVVHQAVKERSARRLYAKALLALSEEVAETSLENFPYDSMRDAIRRRYDQLHSELDNLLQQLSATVATPEKQIPALWAQMRGQRVDPVIRRGLEQDHRWHDRVAVTQFIMELRGLKITVSGKRPAAKELVAAARAYQEMFPAEKEMVSETGGGRFAIELPSPELLAPMARKALADLNMADTDQLTRRLSERVDDAQLSEATNARIGETLAKISRERGILRGLGRSSLQILTLAAPIAAGAGIHHLGFDSVLLYILVGNIASRPFYLLNVATADQFLRARLNEWFHGLQKSVTADFLNSTLSQPLMSAIDDDDGRRLHALATVQEALRFLDPSFKPLPLQH